MAQSRLSRSEVWIIVGFALVFGVLAAFGLRAYLNRDNRWVQIVGPTDDRAVEIVAVTRLLQPYVRTANDSLYRCTGSTWQDRCEAVQVGDVPVAKIPERWRTCVPEFPELPPLRAAVVDSLDAGQCQEARTYARLVILEDGTIWKWQRTFSWAQGFGFASGLLWSLAIGAVVGWAFVWLRRYFRTPVPEHPVKGKTR